MRRLWDNKKFFSFYEHLSPSDIERLLVGNKQAMEELARKGVVIGPPIGFLIEKRPENQETVLNSIIGIA